MTNPAKAKGDRSEREVAALLNDHLGWPARRKLGAGRADDTGDIDCGPGISVTVQVAAYKDAARAIREKVLSGACEAQQARAGSDFGVTFLRRPGGRYVAVMSFEQWCAWAHEATQVQTRRYP